MTAKQKKNTSSPPLIFNFPIIAIGASTGGLNTLQSVIKNLPSDLGAAYIAIQHFDPNQENQLASLLKKQTSMEICLIKAHQPILPNKIYIAPGGKFTEIDNGQFIINTTRNKDELDYIIDHFFFSLAESHKDLAIGIILNGLGNDGATGLKKIKLNDGYTIMQDPNEAGANLMPFNEANSVAVDSIISINEIAPLIISYVKTLFQSHSPEIPAPPKIDINQEELKQILSVIKFKTGHDFFLYKKNTLIRRLERRIRLHNYSSFLEYYEFIKNNQQEPHLLFKEFLVGVTEFFRDTAAFSYLGDTILPQLIEEKYQKGQSFRIWIPACSTGEEVYTIAILCMDIIEKKNHNLNLQIFASDVDNDAINFARKGFYPLPALTNVPDSLREKYFIQETNGYRVKKHIRELIVFAPHDTISDPPYFQLDLISCRNMLIYLTVEMQKQVISMFLYALNPDGILFLGNSESPGQLSIHFQIINKRWKFFKKISNNPDYNLSFKFPRYYNKEKNFPTDINKNSDLPLTIKEYARELIMERYMPSAIIVDESFDIVYITGKAGIYLERKNGRPSNSMMENARDGLRIPLVNALRSAARNQRKELRDNVQVKFDNEIKNIRFEIIPIDRHPTMINYSLILFSEYIIPPGSTYQNNDNHKLIESEKDMRIHELENELLETRMYLQTTIDELGNTNEELTSSNEEAQSVNEELQSTNEEVESSKEELQAANEELNALNVEYQQRIDELTILNNDIHNFIRSTQVGILFLDRKLNVIRFTPAISTIIDLIDSDIGRPLSTFITTLINHDLAKNCMQVLDTLQPIEEEVQTNKNLIFLLRILPYRTLKDTIEGIVLVFMDITERKQAEQQLIESEQRFRALFDVSPDPIIVHKQGIISYVNNAANSLLGLCNTDELQGTSLQNWIAESESVKKAIIQPILDKTENQFVECNFNRSNGSTVKTEIVMAVYKDKGENYNIIIARDISERKRWEAKLIQSEQRFRLFFDKNPLPMWVLDPEYLRFIEVNETAIQYYGYSHEDFLAMNLDSLRPDKAIDELKNDYQRMKSEFPNTFLTQHQKKDGSIIDVEVTVYQIELSNQFLTIAVVRDRTKQLKAERSLLTSENKYRLLYESMQDAFVRQDLDGRITECNNAYLDLTGYKLEEVIHQKSTTMTPDYWDEFEKKYLSEKVLPRGYSDIYEMEYRRKDGKIIPVELRTFVYKDDNGIPKGLWSIVRDITERKKTEKELLQKTEQYESFARNFQGIAYQLNAGNLMPLMYAGAVEKITGYTVKEFMTPQINWVKLVHPHDRGKFLSTHKIMFKDPSYIANNEYRIIRKDGEIRFIRDIAQIINKTDKGMPILQGAIYDITEQKASIIELQKQERLESLGVLAGGIAHDFNNFLGGIFGHVEITREYLKNNQIIPAIENLDKTLFIFNRARELTQQLLTFAKGGTPVKKVIHLGQLLQDAVHFALSGTNISSEFIISPDLWPCEADIGQINQVINNMVINSLQAMPVGGIIRITADNIQQSALKKLGLPQGKFIAITLSDTGIGIAPELLTRIYEPFFTTKQKGSGLGLATSYSIIQKHGGMITVKSELGKGTEFTIYLPAQADSEISEQNSHKITLKGNGRVLIMDDEESIRTTTQFMLESMGFSVDCTKNAEDTIKQAKSSLQETNPYRIAILDLTIPGSKGGQDCVDDLRKMIPAIKLIAISGYSENPVMAKPEDFGFDASLPKPFLKNEMAKVISKIIYNN